MQTELPWYESAEEATLAAIHAGDKPLKAVASELWPGKTMDAAHCRLRACLNENRDEKLTADEHLQIAEITGQDNFLYYCAARRSHSKPEPITPQDQQNALMREYVDATRTLERISKRMQMIKGVAA